MDSGAFVGNADRDVGSLETADADDVADVVVKTNLNLKKIAPDFSISTKKEKKNSSATPNTDHRIQNSHFEQSPSSHSTDPVSNLQ